VVEDASINLDLVYRRTLSVLGHEINLGVSGRNLLNEDHVETRTGTGEDINTYARGSSWSISLSREF
jgi:hypothetical protein